MRLGFIYTCTSLSSSVSCDTGDSAFLPSVAISALQMLAIFLLQQYFRFCTFTLLSQLHSAHYSNVKLAFVTKIQRPEEVVSETRKILFLFRITLVTTLAGVNLQPLEWPKTKTRGKQTQENRPLAHTLEDSMVCLTKCRLSVTKLEKIYSKTHRRTLESIFFLSIFKMMGNNVVDRVYGQIYVVVPLSLSLYSAIVLS